MSRQIKMTHSIFIRWLLSHVRAVKFAFSELLRAPISNFITLCVIGIAIALPVGFFVLLQNLQTVDTTWNISTPTISLYLKSDITSAQANNLIQSLQNNSDIAKINYVSPDQGLALFEKNTPFNNIGDLFQHNPIPGVVTVFPTTRNQNPQAINTLFQTLKALPLVDVAQLDVNWVTRLFDIVSIGKKITNAISLLFGFGVILIIGHTLRSSLSDHINEIQVMRLIGATNAYIRRPLLYRGILYGLLGSIIALLLILIFFSQLQSPIAQLAQTYQTPFHLQKISFLLSFKVLCASMLAGLIGAWIITTQFLNQPELTD
ncbi:MAG TPA: permease-like cell division protein FtsX [Coxiellaceae bacterium]|nr:MAG: hypothetical protein A2W44_14965 [Acinetobacter sp. RIFCSPHIGHO2_12_41_5]OGT40835.1 MAG: hypothetical protein A3E81_05005 [Gammaproteobacteria bacterium RIFCSPHIGHO2_12_FULL_36_30]HLB55883.1 permease-like cell division protein FtsX [Coxiellaceae bacterium]